MDENYLEHAERMEHEVRERAIQEASYRAAPQKHPCFDGLHCVQCDGEIPAGRLALGRVRCIHCQEYLERHHRERNLEN